MGESCDIIKNNIDRVEKEIATIQVTISDISHEISNSKEKYMPAVSLINELKIQMAKLMEDVHLMHLNLSNADSRLQASTDSSHKRLDSAHDIIQKLSDLPITIRKDMLKFLAVIATVIIGFGSWTANNINANKVRISVIESKIDSIANNVRDNTLNISKTYQTIKIYMKGNK